MPETRRHDGRGQARAWAAQDGARAIGCLAPIVAAPGALLTSSGPRQRGPLPARRPRGPRTPLPALVATPPRRHAAAPRRRGAEMRGEGIEPSTPLGPPGLSRPALPICPPPRDLHGSPEPLARSNVAPSSGASFVPRPSSFVDAGRGIRTLNASRPSWICARRLCLFAHPRGSPRLAASRSRVAGGGTRTPTPSRALGSRPSGSPKFAHSGVFFLAHRCGGRDSNPHRLSASRYSAGQLYQFAHPRGSRSLLALLCSSPPRSGRRDSNPRPPVSQTGTLTRLRYVPSCPRRGHSLVRSFARSLVRDDGIRTRDLQSPRPDAIQTAPHPDTSSCPSQVRAGRIRTSVLSLPRRAR